MCNVLCTEFKGWCKSFTKTELCLAILEFILLLVFITFLLFLILHLISCRAIDETVVIISTTSAQTHTVPDTLDAGKYIMQYTTETPNVTDTSVESTSTSPGIACTWKFSKKTPAFTHYYEIDDRTESYLPDGKVIAPTLVNSPSAPVSSPLEPVGGSASWLVKEDSDGEDADDTYKSFVLALVKLNPPYDLTFGCILTIVSEHWTLTAASCVESIEEIDSLDSFVMLENYGETIYGKTHAVIDIQVHPQYQGANRSFDIVALKSEDSLFGVKKSVQLPTMIDYFMVTVGEQLTLLGFGKFRSIESGVKSSRSVRAVRVWSVGGTQCGAGGEGWAPRHLSRGDGVGRGAGGPRALCVGPLRARAAPCNYCAGAPLLAPAPARTLLALMADARQCGLACEPALYVNVAAVREWLDSVTTPQ